MIVTNLAYPLGDILLLSAVVGVFALTGWRPGRTWVLIGAALAATAIADGIFLFQTATGTLHRGTILDALWPASMLLLAAAAWQPRRRIDVALEGRPLLATPLVVRARSAWDPRPRPLPPLEPPGGRPGRRDLSRRGRPARRHLPREHPHRRADAHARRHRRSHRPRQPAPARRPTSTARSPTATDGEPRLLVIFDLDGFKLYNDTFGHPAGDALLHRLAARAGRGRRADAALPTGSGGDEFCVLADVAAARGGAFLERRPPTPDASRATASRIDKLVRRGPPPEEASTSSDAYASPTGGCTRRSASARGRRGASRDAAPGALRAGPPSFGTTSARSSRPRLAIGEALGLGARAARGAALAAQLHDIGKLAVPGRRFSRSPARSTVEEWAFIREHTLIGERILAAAPVWRAVGAIVRATPRALGR